MAGPRQAEPQDLLFAPGLDTDATDRGSPGRWRSGDNTRWRDGLPEKIGGYIQRALTLPDGTTAANYFGRARSCWEWDSLDGQNWIGFGTECKLYVINNARLYDITPLRRQALLTNPFTTTLASAIVTVVDTNHGANVGDFIRVTNATAVGGITISGEYQVTEVVDLNTYTITHTAPAGAAATGGGIVTIQYDINCGLVSDTALFGYGVADYGEEEYGTARSASTFTGKARVWSLDNWGEDFAASPNGSTIYIWRRVTGPDSRATEIINAPDQVEHMIIGPDDRHMIALGCNLASTNVQDRMFVRWCAGDNYDLWLAANDNDAGSKRLDNGSRLITAVKTRNSILVWSDRGIYLISFVGGTDVYDIRFMATCGEIISKNASADVNGVVYFMTKKNFYRWDGVLTVLDTGIDSFVFGTQESPQISEVHGPKVSARVNEEFNEIWWSYPSFNAIENDRTAIYNYKDDVWYLSSIPRETGRDRNTVTRKPYAFFNNRLWTHEQGVDGRSNDGLTAQPLVAFLESNEGHIGGSATELLINYVIPDFKTLTGSVNFRMFGREYPADARVNGDILNVTAASRQVDYRFRQRQSGIRVESSALGDNWRMGVWRALATPTSRRG